MSWTATDRDAHMATRGLQDVTWRGTQPYHPDAAQIEFSLSDALGRPLLFRIDRAGAAALSETLSEAVYGSPADQYSKCSGTESACGLPQEGQNVSPFAIA